MKQQIIQQGAEAVLIKRGNDLLKRRVAKSYRLAELDEKIRKLRTRGEGKLLERARKVVAVPEVKKVDEKTKEIDMEFIDGRKLSEHLDEMKNWKEVCFEIGRNIAKLHDVDIIHGDLTTSNMIWVEGKLDEGVGEIGRQLWKGALSIGAHFARSEGKQMRDCSGVLYFIDFGLGFSNGRIEDKAVDLYLIKEALEAKHFKRFEDYFKAVLDGYKKTSKNAKDVLKRLEKVEKRGRYKEQY